MAEEAAPLERTALSLGLVVPSPVPMTESDEEQPQSAQVSNAQDVGNSDNAEGAATISIPIVQARMVQTAGPDDSGSHTDRLHPANFQELDPADAAEDEADPAESELEDVGTKRRRKKNGDIIRRPRMGWRSVEVISRSENSDEDIQKRLNEIASSVYEQAGTAYPPGSLSMTKNLRYF
jgi:hypothetical protein